MRGGLHPPARPFRSSRPLRFVSFRLEFRFESVPSCNVLSLAAAPISPIILKSRGNFHWGPALPYLALPYLTLTSKYPQMELGEVHVWLDRNGAELMSRGGPLHLPGQKDRAAQ
jgi:hypothetical protein